MFDSYFSNGQQLTLALAFLLALLAMVRQVQGHDRQAVLLLLGSALVMRFFAALLDPYLNMWDESVHVLVAKNMGQDPFKPMLFREEALGLRQNNWIEGHLWLHKQPMFLWLMAISIKVLGPSVLSARLPSVLLTTAWVYFTYGMGRALYGRNVAFMAALLMTFTNWTLSQAAGFDPTDHNDAAFVTFVGGSLWAWYAVLPSRPRRGTWLIGIFVGCAVLTKWLTGLLVFGGWGLAVLLDRTDRPGDAKRLVKALAIAAAIAAPWQIYAWLRFPVEMGFEMDYNSRHFSEVLEGHSGTSAFYFEVMREKLFPFEPYTLCLMLLMALLALRHVRERAHALVTTIGLLSFFTAAASKMAGYMLPVVPYFFMGVAYWIDRSVSAVFPKRWPDVQRMAVAGFLAIMLLNVADMQLRHTAQGEKLDGYFARYRPARLHNLEAMKILAAELEGVERPLVFGLPYPENLNFSFFHGIEAIPWLPGDGYCDRLHDAGHTVVVVDPPPDWPLPRHVKVIRGPKPMFLQP